MAKAKEETAEKQEKKSKLDLVKEALNKKYGEGIVQGGDETPRYTDVVSTGSIKFDLATKIGGIPLTGCIIEFMGWESSGKSTFCLYIMGNAQRKTGKRVLLMDSEQAFDPKYAKSLGVDVEKVDVSQPECGEDAYNIAEELLDTGEYCLCVIDSQTGFKPKKVTDGQVGDSHLGLEARMMGDAVNKMKLAAKRNNVPVIFISQFREKIGVMYGSPETTSGGNALKFYAHMRVEVRRSVDMEDGVATANKTKVKVIKNKFAPPFGVGEEIYIEYGKGVNRAKEILDVAVEMDIIKASGSWYSYKEDKLGQGKDKVLDLLFDNPELMDEIENKVLENIKL